jgi:cytochrome b6-f complex subunit 5
MIEPLISGIVLGLIPVTLIGLFITAYLQFNRGNELSRIIKKEQRVKIN